MNHTTLLEELHQLLDQGEPLLTTFPREHPNDLWLQLPDNISQEMRWYTDEVAYRAWDPEAYQTFRQKYSNNDLKTWIKHFTAGLLGWRAIGVL